jgi:hypothetical protein
VLGVQQRKSHESIKAYPWVCAEKRLHGRLHLQYIRSFEVLALPSKPGLHGGGNAAFAG